MKRTINNTQEFAIVLSLLVFTVGTALTAKTRPPADHPSFFQALDDLRYAREHLQRPDGGQLQVQETRAINAIDAAINDIKMISADDGRSRNTRMAPPDKYLNNNRPIDSRLDWPSRLRRATELVNKAQSYVVQDQGDSSDQVFQRLRRQALEDIDKARRNIEEAIHLVQ
jgi:hypothetical protein